MALTTTTPAAGFSTTLRPPAAPTSAASELCTSRQKSASEVVRTWALSSGRLPGPLLVVVLLPVLVVLLPAPAVVMALELTRMSLAPWRRPGR